MPIEKRKTRVTKGEQKILISISMDVKLIERIDRLANDQNRTRSNFIVNAMREALEDEED